jgi:hypothetical protein
MNGGSHDHPGRSQRGRVPEARPVSDRVGGAGREGSGRDLRRLARGETVKLSSFGSFLVRSKGQRVGRNPKTGVEVPIEPRRVMVFKPSNVLKARINGANGADPDA